MLSCKQVATLASEYLEHHDSKLNWKVRLHLLMCANCRRFIRHLKITNRVVQKTLSESPSPDTDTDQLLLRIKEASKNKNNE